MIKIDQKFHEHEISDEVVPCADFALRWCRVHFTSIQCTGTGPSFSLNVGPYDLAGAPTVPAIGVSIGGAIGVCGENVTFEPANASHIW